MKKKGTKNLTYTQRLILESCLNAKVCKKDIAEKLGVSLATVYNEIKRGQFEKKVLSYTDYWGDKHYKTVVAYSPEIAQENYELGKTAKGAPLKVGNDFDFVRYVEKRVLEDKLSPCAVVGEIKRNKMFRTVISKTTMYRYIELGIFLNIKMRDLPFGRRKKHYRKVTAKRAPKGVSIENRPVEIAERKTFGNWEMDCVVGKKETKETLLVLTERLTRYEIIIKMCNRKTETVVKCLDRLERRYGKRFKTVFKTITVDNGVEFSDFVGIERSTYSDKQKRTNVYYCHPYTSCERGSNERLNREIRRLLPKGSDFSLFSDDDIKVVENWVNDYPREIFGYATSSEMFSAQLLAI